MALEIIRKVDVQDLDELERSFRPIECREMDVTGWEAMQLGLAVRPNGGYRVFIVYAVCKDDANKRRHIAKVLGPATGEMQVSVPCGLEVEWAWVQEAMEARAEKARDRMIARAERLATWQRRMDQGLINVAENMQKQKVGASTFGFGGKLQRESS